MNEPANEQETATTVEETRHRTLHAGVLLVAVLAGVLLAMTALPLLYRRLPNDFDRFRVVIDALASMSPQIVVIATNPSDFWRRWHISLSSWLRDYLYTPLGGSRHGEWKTVRNLMITMLLGGLWHGAHWNFVLWGGFHGSLLVGHHLWRRRPRAEPASGVPGALGRFMAWGVCQYSILLTWIVFRVHDLGPMQVAMRKFILFDFDFALTRLGLASVFFTRTVVIIAFFWLLHFVSSRWGDLDRRVARLPLPAAAAVCIVVGFVMLLFWPTERQPFIYFQF